MNYMKFLFGDWTDKDVSDATKYSNRTAPILGLLMIAFMGCVLIIALINGGSK